MSSHGVPPGVPAVVRSKALAADAGRWIRDLPELVAGIERDWSIAVGRPYQDSTEAFVAGAVLGDGTPAVLKRGAGNNGPVSTAEVSSFLNMWRSAGAEGVVEVAGVGDFVHNYIADFGEQWKEHGALGIITDFGAAGEDTWNDTKHLVSDVGSLASSAWHGITSLF